MGPTWDIQIKVAKGVLILNGLIALVSTFFITPWLPFFMGLLFGSLIGLLNFRLLSLTLEKAVKMPPGKAQAYASSQYFLRYIIMGAVIYISIQADYIHVLGTILGLISIKLVILKTELFSSKEFFQNIFKRREGE